MLRVNFQYPPEWIEKLWFAHDLYDDDRIGLLTRFWHRKPAYRPSHESEAGKALGREPLPPYHVELPYLYSLRCGVSNMILPPGFLVVGEAFYTECPRGRPHPHNHGYHLHLGNARDVRTEAEKFHLIYGSPALNEITSGCSGVVSTLIPIVVHEDALQEAREQYRDGFERFQSLKNSLMQMAYLMQMA